jgi:RimJ/RimL family protein N-acetyltransferase
LIGHFILLSLSKGINPQCLDRASITLTGQHIQLITLNKDHFTELESLAADARIWQHYVYDGTDSQRFRTTLIAALTEMLTGTQLPFVVYHTKEKRLIGATRFMDIQPAHKKLEIGSTWYHPDYWGSEVNLECKLLMLTYCFENVGALRVQFKTDENNIRSRKAIEKIGAKFEGVLRHDMLRDNGTNRNSAYYSIINVEWDNVKAHLSDLLRVKTKV